MFYCAHSDLWLAVVFVARKMAQSRKRDAPFQSPSTPTGVILELSSLLNDRAKKLRRIAASDNSKCRKTVYQL